MNTKPTFLLQHTYVGNFFRYKYSTTNVSTDCQIHNSNPSWEIRQRDMKIKQAIKFFMYRVKINLVNFICFFRQGSVSCLFIETRCYADIFKL